MSVQQNDRHAAMNNDNGMLHLMVEAATALTQLVDGRPGMHNMHTTTSSSYSSPSSSYSSPTQPIKAVHYEHHPAGTTDTNANDKPHRHGGIVTPPLATRPAMLHRRGGGKDKVLTTNNGPQRTVVSDNDDDMCTVVTNTSTSTSSSSQSTSSSHVHVHGIVTPSFSTNHASAADFSATPVPPSSSPPQEIVHSRTASSSSSSSPSGKSSKSLRETFPQKLMRILSNREVEGVIRWLPHGHSFLIVHPHQFAESVLPLYYNNNNIHSGSSSSVHNNNNTSKNKYPSFTRKLNRWGFRQMTCRGPEAGAFSHALFSRDTPSLCTGMVCEKSSNHNRKHRTKKSSPTSPSSKTSHKTNNNKTTPNSSSIPQTDTTKTIITQQDESIVTHKKRLLPGDSSSCSSSNNSHASSSRSLPPKKRRVQHVELSNTYSTTCEYNNIKDDGVQSSVTRVHNKDTQESSNHKYLTNNNNKVKMMPSCTNVSSTVSKDPQQQQQKLSTSTNDDATLTSGPFAMLTLELLDQRRKMADDAMTMLMQHHSRTVKTTQTAQLSKSFHKAILSVSPPSSSSSSLLPTSPAVTDSNTTIGPIGSSPLTPPPPTPNMIDPPSLDRMATKRPTPKPRDTAKNMLYEAYLQAVAAKGGSTTTPAPTTKQ
eukprot:scaffold178536_cov46-Attheya_sp.AAC.1